MTIGTAEIEAAAELLRGVAITTPMEESRWLSALVGGPVLLKCENLQRTGSFKIRGAYVRMSHLSAEDSVEFTRRLVPHLKVALQQAGPTNHYAVAAAGSGAAVSAR